MSNSPIIAIDAMGGDFGPDVTIPAMAEALNKQNDLRFLIFGDQKRCTSLLNSHSKLKAASEFVHTDIAISGKDKPSSALRNGKGSSMRLAIEAVKEGKAQFAVLGAVYAKVVQGISNPTVGLLNIGTEEMKGHDEIRAAADVLSNVPFPGRYHGFIEGDDITKGTVNVVVTDGFTGNVALKTAEGVAKLMKHFLTDAFKSSPLAIMGYLLSMGAIGKMKNKVDPRKYNGGMFLGINGICVKSHGGSDELGTENAILVAADLIRNDFNAQVANEIESLMEQESFVQAVGV